MFKLIGIEFRKLLPYRSFWVILAAYSVIVSLIFYGIHSETFMIGQFTRSMMFYPEIWHTTVYIASWLNLLLIFIVVMYSSNEFSYKTYRQNVIDGLSRIDLLWSKMLFIAGVSFFSSLLIFIIGLFTGSYVEGTEDKWPLFVERIHFLAFHFIKTYSYLSLAFLFSIIFRRSMLSVILLLLYVVGEYIAVPVIMNLASDGTLPEFLGRVVKFLPLNVYTELIPLPTTLFSNTFPSKFTLSTEMALALTAAYGFIFNGLAYWILEKRNI